MTGSTVEQTIREGFYYPTLDRQPEGYLPTTQLILFTQLFKNKLRLRSIATWRRPTRSFRSPFERCSLSKPHRHIFHQTTQTLTRLQQFQPIQQDRK